MKLCEFDKLDYAGFAGAESFDEDIGSGFGPFIGETENFIIILDKTGIEVITEGAESGDIEVGNLEFKSNQDSLFVH